MHEGLSRCLPSAVGAVVQGYCEPSEEEVWDEVAGVPLGDVWGEVVDLATENSRLREEITRLRERVERECGKVASLEEENLRLLRLREMESQKEGRGGLKKRCQAWAWTRWSGVTAAPCRRPNCWIHRTLFPHV